MQLTSPPTQFSNPELDNWLRELHSKLANVPVFVDVPATSTSPGTEGEMAYDEDYLYYCYDVDSWKRMSWVAF